MNNPRVNSLINRVLAEAIPGVITAEKVPTGGENPGGGGSFGGMQDLLGGEGANNREITISADEETCEAVLQALGALKTSGAKIDNVKYDGQDTDLSQYVTEPNDHDADNAPKPGAGEGEPKPEDEGGEPKPKGNPFKKGGKPGAKDKKGADGGEEDDVIDQLKA